MSEVSNDVQKLEYYLSKDETIDAVRFRIKLLNNTIERTTSIVTRQLAQIEIKTMYAILHYLN